MIIGSCGHELNNVEGNAVSYPSVDRCNTDCTVYATVCDDCLGFYVTELNATTTKNVVRASSNDVSERKSKA